MKLRFKIAIASLSLLLIACQSTPEMDWNGKWLNTQENWGLEIRNEKIFEWERGTQRNEATYKIIPEGENFNLVINAKGKPVTFPVRVINDRKIQLKQGQNWLELEKK